MDLVYDYVSLYTVEDVEGEYLVVEGYANKFKNANGDEVVDDYNTSFSPLSFQWENYLKNPIVLYMHNLEVPIGRVEEISKKDNGLYIKAKIFKHSHPVAYYNVRNKVVTGFSIGVRILEEYWSDLLNAWAVASAELVEISVVSLPSNMDSHIENVSMCDSGECLTVRKSKKAMTIKPESTIDQKIVKRMISSALSDIKNKEL